MLDDIKQCIRTLPNVDFSEYYQQYVKQVQDSILDNDLLQASHCYKMIEDTPKLLSGLNILTEELKTFD